MVSNLTSVRKGQREDAALAALLAFVPDFSGDQDAITAELKAAYLAAYRAADASTPVDAATEQRATRFAHDRTATLLDDLAQTTQDDIAALVDAAEADDWSLDEIGDALSGHHTFSAARALLIAATETAIAWGRASRSAAEDQGQDEKQWLGGECEDCKANAEDSWIPIDEAFSSGDDDVPAHPNCSCEVSYRTRGGDEDKAVRLTLVKDAKCPQCRRWVGRNIPIGSECYCPKHHGVRIEA